MFKINLMTHDGAKISFDADSAETLLEAAAKANIFFPASCREGGCGTCRVRCEAGGVDLESYSKSALSEVDRAAGEILLCRATARGDLQLIAPFDKAAVSFAPIPERKARIKDITFPIAGAARLILNYEDDPNFGVAAEFSPGQFMKLTPPGMSIARSYSIANTPNWDGTLEFLIRLHPQGRFSDYLKDKAKEGDQILVTGPQGSFALHDSSQAPRWFVAGGTGIAPILSMLRQMAEFSDSRETRLFFGVTTQDEFFARDEIEALQKSLPRFAATFCVWKPEPDWTGFSGTPAAALAAALAEKAATPPDIYVCGPPALIEASKDAALNAGVLRDHFFCELFVGG